MTVAVLTIAGSDPSGGAGLQADLKTFHQHRVYGMSVVTLLTVQNTRSVDVVQPMEAQFVIKQLDAVVEDIPPVAAKTGALGSKETIAAVAERASDFEFPLVVDPVMISKHGVPLLDDSAIELFKRQLLPQAFLVTPNLHEAGVLTGMAVQTVQQMETAARRIAELGVENVLVKGGHLDDDPLDLLYCGPSDDADEQIHLFKNKRIATQHTHGTGCVLSAAITARIGRGDPVVKGISGAKKFISAAIETNPHLGHGFGPINLFADVAPF